MIFLVDTSDLFNFFYLTRSETYEYFVSVLIKELINWPLLDT
jgi:hypothetical protein